MTIKLIAQLEKSSHVPLQLFIESVPAGFPSPAEGYSEGKIDLNDLCISHPAATFLVQTSGLSMVDAGIYDGDYLIVDRSLEAKNGDIIIARLAGEFTVKELSVNPPKLIAHNKDYDDIPISEDTDFEVFGVVTSVVRNFRK